jgi:GMP synthase-like glutamine amidotransferase
MTIGILETGRPPAALRAQWGSYDDMIRTMLGRNRKYRSYDVQAGDLPAEPTDCSAYVITGSAAGVSDDRIRWSLQEIPHIAQRLAIRTH